MWDAFPTGRTVELAPFTPSGNSPAGANAPSDGHTWGPERTVRAQVITSLLLGARDVAAGSAPAVRLTGARITGPLEIVGGTVEHDLSLSGCHLDEPIRLTGTTARTVSATPPPECSWRSSPDASASTTPSTT